MEKMLITGTLFLVLNSCILFNIPILCQSPYDIPDAPIKEILQLIEDSKNRVNKFDLELDGKKYNFGGSYYTSRKQLKTDFEVPKGYKGRLWLVFDNSKGEYKYIKFDSIPVQDGIERITVNSSCFNDTKFNTAVEIYNNENKYFRFFSLIEVKGI